MSGAQAGGRVAYECDVTQRLAFERPCVSLSVAVQVSLRMSTCTFTRL